MGQVVKYVVGLCPRAEKIIKQPWPGWLEILLRVQQLGLVACLIILSLTFSGESWEPRGATGNVGLIELSLQLLEGSHSPATPVGDQEENVVFIEPAPGGQDWPSPQPEMRPAVPELPVQDNPGVSPHETAMPTNGPRLKLGTPYLRSVPGAGKRVAITFDDGPFPEWTERYLKVLEVTQTPATFFMIAKQAAGHPELVKAVLAGGHEVASHSWRHANLSKVSAADAEADLRRAATSLEQITGEPVKYFRPPYGALSPNLLEAAEKTGVQTVNWSVDPRDWSNPGPKVIVQRIMDTVHEGSIILLHEAHAGTLTALPILIKNLRDQGYELVTVSDLIASSER